MAHGRVLLSGPEDDPLVTLLRDRLRDAGYWPQRPALGRAALYESEASALPIVAALDLWSDMPEERLAALTVLDAQMSAGSPLLVRCESEPVDELARQVRRASRVVGCSLLALSVPADFVELIPGTVTSSEAVRRAVMFTGSFGLHAEVLRPGTWPIYPRLLAFVINEAAHALGEGVASAADIDLVMRVVGNWRHGPLAAADALGLDRVLEILAALQQEYGERYRPAPLLRRLVRAGYTGNGAGRGFHRSDRPVPPAPPLDTPTLQT
jgi:3-hydroxybutyryl-CoA dehydrogenase